jgi:hypothetical protein
MIVTSSLVHKSLSVGVAAPAFVCCRTCSATCRLNEIRTITRQHGNMDEPTVITAMLGCYICPRCPKGERWFRLSLPGFEGRSRYTPATRAAVRQLLKVGKTSFEAAERIARQILNLPKLHSTTIMRWFRSDGEDVDMRDHLSRALKVFSGQFAIDEVYDGTYYVVRVTDPINRIELMTRLGVGSPTADDIADLLSDLRGAGFQPELIVTDGAELYPAILREIFPLAAHQSCVFHFMQLANKKLVAAWSAAVSAMPQPKKRGRGRPKKRGRPREDGRKRRNIEKVRKVRYIVFMRDPDHAQQALLDDAIVLCPSLSILRRFVMALQGLFDSGTPEQAQERRRALLADEVFRALPGAATILSALADNEAFAKFTRYLGYENAERTSNHAERENREFRKRQKAHYKLRTERSMKASLALLTTRHHMPAVAKRLVRRQPPGSRGLDTREVLAA